MLGTRSRSPETDLHAPVPLTRAQKIAFVAGQVDLDGAGLELGPHVAPMFRKSEGRKVEYLETRTTAQLRDEMVKQGRDPAIVEEIDHILERGRTLDQMTGGKRFDWVASSHVIEHIPDIIGHLREVTEVLKPGGVYAAIVPDRNYCFDCLKSATTLGQVIECHLHPQARPGALGHMIDEWRYGARPEGVSVGGWTPDQAQRPLVGKYPGWKDRVRAVLKTGGEEVERWFGHQWFFDPLSFAQIISDLNALDLVQLQLDALRPTFNMDFIAILRKTESPDPQKALGLRAEVAKTYRVPDYDLPR